MSVRGVVAALGAGAGAWVLMHSVRAKTGEVVEAVEVRAQPAANGNTARIGGLLSLVGGLVNSSTGGVIFNLSGSGAGSNLGSTIATAAAEAIGITTGAATGSARALLDLIGSVEAPRGYTDYYRGVSEAPPKPLTSMTVGEVMAWQNRINARSNSEAAGRYQIIRQTLAGLVSQGVLTRGELFNSAAQDRAAMALLERRGLSRFKSGSLSRQRFAQNLSQEWASLPCAITDKRGRAAAGQSYYAGDGLNRSLTSLSRVYAALDQIRG